MRAAPSCIAALALLVTRTATPNATAERAPLAVRVRIPAGEFVQGRNDAERLDERPAHRVSVQAFELDATLVTRAAFARFVDETGYVTSAEELGFGMAAREGMDDWEWARAPHASWRAPFLEGTAEVDAFLRPDAPVVMVSFVDAEAYCRHYGARLPSEAEWEYAMRANSQGTRYPWGDGPERDGKIGLNFWQGASHHKNERIDGYLYVSPVRAFPPNAWGAFDPVGNVWQWTADSYAPDAYARAVRGLAPTIQGDERVLRGGSWWCGACTCEGMGLFYRGKARPRAAYNNNGFRCAR
jgi:formylglycine-generating enzyme required for sulfatase activity